MASARADQAWARFQAQNVLTPAHAPVRSLFGVLFKDLPRYVPALVGVGEPYLALCNRNEVLRGAPDGSGYQCEWRWTSDLHAPKIMPSLGTRLMGLALRDHPVRFSDAPPRYSGLPEVTFIIGHRGVNRLPHLLKTLESIAGQSDAAIECIVVEQEVEACLRGRLPAWVRHVHTPPPRHDMPFCRAWAFNVGARHAQGRLLILHDNDILMSADYATLSLNRMRAGFDVINLKRFGFYLNETHTQEVFAGGAGVTAGAPESIVQNLLAGGSVAIEREAYLRIGGMDEGFIGWGGEDNEFWERAETLKTWPYSRLPYVHLWHPAQAGKYEAENPTLARYRRVSGVEPARRIEILRSTPFGEVGAPFGWRGVTEQREHNCLSRAADRRSSCGVEG